MAIQNPRNPGFEDPTGPEIRASCWRPRFRHAAVDGGHVLCSGDTENAKRGRVTGRNALDASHTQQVNVTEPTLVRVNIHGLLSPDS